VGRILFERYPRLRDRVRFEEILSLPSPVTEHRGVWVKRDDRIGGGKLRKLEFYLPDKPLVAFGGRGSNWLRALAAHRKVRIVTWPQRHNPHSLRNLGHIPGVHAHDWMSFGMRWLLEAPRFLSGAAELVPLGGSDPVTTLGHVEGALELAAQVERGECPRPDAVFVPLGTAGMAAGLALGFRLAGLEVTVHAVRVGLPGWANWRRLYGLASQAAWLLDETPRLARVIVERGFYGGYAAPIPEVPAAQEFFRPLDLDATYTAKAAACLLARSSGLRTPLLWLSYGAPSC
jgi:D-cysteine desulfhydrase